MDLKAAVVLGGDSMDSQFEALHGNPDIIVATPGRFMHVCVEMELRLSSVEIIVFDEADRWELHSKVICIVKINIVFLYRLFEMGFGEQLKDIVARLPAGRQTLLFSATLPKVLVEFTRAGLSDPVLLRYQYTGIWFSNSI
jgi:ATP-dependent RNA helicase DDX54/DBP10